MEIQMTCKNCGKLGHNKRTCKIKGQFTYLTDPPEGSQSQTQTDGSQTQSQVEESLVGSQVTEATKVMKKKLAVERRMVMTTSDSTPLHASQDVQGSAVSSNTNTPLQGQMRWRGRVVYNASAVKSPLGATTNVAETKYLENE
ncbi:unnamed protein product [Camellia sinensis]